MLCSSVAAHSVACLSDAIAGLASQSRTLSPASNVLEADVDRAPFISTSRAPVYR